MTLRRFGILFIRRSPDDLPENFSKNLIIMLMIMLKINPTVAPIILPYSPAYSLPCIIDNGKKMTNINAKVSIFFVFL